VRGKRRNGFYLIHGHSFTVECDSGGGAMGFHCRQTQGALFC
jgi:hypothetical protein